jgi:bile acid:Na+ symporter, BASS family
VIQKNDLLLLAVIFASMAFGIGFPGLAEGFTPYPLYLMMFLLFFSLLKIDFGQAFQDLKKAGPRLFVLCLVKLLILPAALYFLTRAIWPKYAIPVLLLSGISTGVVAPFISNLLHASTFLVLTMVVISSLLAPFSLPALVALLGGKTVEISFLSMVKTLATVVFLPALATAVVRRTLPLLLEKLEKVRFSLSLVIFAVINLGVFGKYSSFFRTNPLELAGALLVAFILSILYYVAGFLVMGGQRNEDRWAGAISLANMNNVLVIVFSSQFFGPLAPTLAAMYMVPFFAMIAPARMAANWMSKSKTR